MGTTLYLLLLAALLASHRGTTAQDNGQVTYPINRAGSSARASANGAQQTTETAVEDPAHEAVKMNDKSNSNYGTINRENDVGNDQSSLNNDENTHTRLNTHRVIPLSGERLREPDTSLQSRRAAIYGTVSRQRNPSPTKRPNYYQRNFGRIENSARSPDVWSVNREITNPDKQIRAYEKQRVSDQAANYVEDDSASLIFHHESQGLVPAVRARDSGTVVIPSSNTASRYFDEHDPHLRLSRVEERRKIFYKNDPYVMLKFRDLEKNEASKRWRNKLFKSFKAFKGTEYGKAPQYRQSWNAAVHI